MWIASYWAVYACSLVNGLACDEAHATDGFVIKGSIPIAAGYVKVMASVPFAPRRATAKKAKIPAADAIQALKSVPETPILTNDSSEIKASIIELRRRHLIVPVAGATVEEMKGLFYQGRSGHMHNAVDLVAPRDTPVHAVEGGRIARLHNSAAGGITIYQTDPTERFVYYYAHLERYENDLKEGDEIRKEQVIGYVGTSGNAPPNLPHLHFQICRLDQGSVFKGTPLDPYEVFRSDSPEAIPSVRSTPKKRGL